MLSTKDPSQNEKVESEKMEKIFQENRHKKKVGVAILVSDKMDFKAKAIKRDTEGHFIILKRRIP